MSGVVNYAEKRYGSQRCRSLEGALAQRIGEHFPRIGGPRFQMLCAKMILEVVFEHLRPSESVRHGQLLWSAIPLNHPPSPRRPTSSLALVPVLLDLCTPQEVEQRIGGMKPREQLGKRCARLCHQAHEQGGLLACSDLALMLGCGDAQISDALTAFEKNTGQLVPRRATLHDAGTCLTHKRIICAKRWIEGKTSDQIARETHHTIKAVDNYLGMFERVRCCRANGMSAQQTAFALGCSLRLVAEHLRLDDDLQKDKGEPES